MCLCFPSNTVSSAFRRAAGVKIISFFLALASLVLLHHALAADTLWFSLSIDHRAQPPAPRAAERAPARQEQQEQPQKQPPRWWAPANDLYHRSNLPPHSTTGVHFDPAHALPWPRQLLAKEEAAEDDSSGNSSYGKYGDWGNWGSNNYGSLVNYSDSILAASSSDSIYSSGNDTNYTNNTGGQPPAVLTQWTLRAVYFTIPRLKVQRRKVYLDGPPNDRWLRMLLSLGGFYEALIDAVVATKIILGISQVAVLPVALAVLVLSAYLLVSCGLAAARKSTSRRRLHEPLLTRPPPREPSERQQRLEIDSSGAGCEESSVGGAGVNGGNGAAFHAHVGEDYVTPTTTPEGVTSTETSLENCSGREWSASAVVLIRVLTAFVAFCTLAAAVLCSAGFAIWSVRAVEDGSQIVVGIGKIIGNEASEWLEHNATVNLERGIIEYLIATWILYVVAVLNMCLEVAVKPFNIYE